MVTIIWIRHGKKAYANSKGPPGCRQHDPSIKPNQTLEIKSRAKELITTYGNPTRCYSSPYARTRETTDILLSEVDNIIPVHYLPEIGEYLGNQKIIDNIPNVQDDTLLHGPIRCNEHIDEFESRCYEHLCSLGIPNVAPSDDVIWIVTHSFVMRTICKLFFTLHGIPLSIPVPYQFVELGAIIFTQENKITELAYLPYTYKYNFIKKYNGRNHYTKIRVESD